MCIADGIERVTHTYIERGVDMVKGMVLLEQRAMYRDYQDTREGGGGHKGGVKISGYVHLLRRLHILHFFTCILSGYFI